MVENKNDVTSDSDEIPMKWLLLALLIIGGVTLGLMKLFEEPVKYRPNSFEVHKTKTIKHEKLFSVNRILWGENNHFFYDNYDSGLLFRTEMPSQLNL